MVMNTKGTTVYFIVNTHRCINITQKRMSVVSMCVFMFVVCGILSQCCFIEGFLFSKNGLGA